MAATRTMLTASWSMQRADHGEQPYWALILLAACLGQIGLPGGGFGFGYGSAGGIAEPPLAFRAPTMETLANPLGRAIPAARITDCLLHPGEPYDFNGRKRTYPDIRLVYWAGGNPFHHHQDTNRLRAAWRRPETIIVHEPWWTATARHADIVLPATTSLERNDIGCAPRDSFVIAMQQAIEPVGDARSDFAIFSELARRLGCDAAYTEGRDEMGWLRHIYDRWHEQVRTNQAAIPEFDRFWQEGWFRDPAARRGIRAVRGFPRRSGTHIGSPRHRGASSFIPNSSQDSAMTIVRRIRPGSSRANGWARHRQRLIRCISSRASRAYRLHSQMDPGPVSARGKVAGREAVAINPADAVRRGIADGDVVRVYNGRGACLAGAVVTDTVSPGVLRLSCGAWYDPLGSDDDPLCVHGNANVLTRDHGGSKLSQGPSCASTLVEIERLSGAAPPVRAFVPPPIVDSAATA